MKKKTPDFFPWFVLLLAAPLVLMMAAHLWTYLRIFLSSK